MEETSELDQLVRLLRFCAALYRATPVEGHGLVAQAAELAHAAELDAEAETLADGGDDADDEATVLTAEDIRTACTLLIDVRRAPAGVPRAEREVVREHYPEVDDVTLDRLEALVGYYTSLLDES